MGVSCAMRAMMALCAAAPSTGLAESWVANHVIRPTAIIEVSDVSLSTDVWPGALGADANIVGMEARVALYPGRPIRASDVGPPALVDRNDTVVLVFRQGALRISTDGRALARGGVGDRIRVMNLSSRTTISGRIARDGTVLVSQ